MPSFSGAPISPHHSSLPYGSTSGRCRPEGVRFHDVSRKRIGEALAAASMNVWDDQPEAEREGDEIGVWIFNAALTLLQVTAYLAAARDALRLLLRVKTTAWKAVARVTGCKPCSGQRPAR